MRWTVNRYFTLAIAIIFLILGTIGIAFSADMQTGHMLIFDVDVVHNMVLFLTGVVAMVVTIMSPAWSRTFNRTIGVIYLLVGLLGLAYPVLYFDGRLLGIMHANLEDHILHLLLGVIALAIGFAAERLPGVATTSAPEASVQDAG